MKTIFVYTILVLIAWGCKKQNLETVVIKVPTIVCNKCEKTIKKAIFSLEGVKDAEVNLETKTVEVKFVPEQTNLETIEITITLAGYDANNRERDQEAYDNLPECCKIH